MDNTLTRPVAADRPAQTDRAGALWLVQVATGMLLVIILGLHMVAHHFVVEGGLRDFDDVIAYVSNPLIFVLEVLFLVVVTVHAMLGLRAILLDLPLSARGRRLVDRALTLFGAITIAYGLWLAIAIQRL
jgi:succinate dehydrogenase hydrophobic anchor subunit